MVKSAEVWCDVAANNNTDYLNVDSIAHISFSHRVCTCVVVRVFVK